MAFNLNKGTPEGSSRFNLSKQDGDSNPTAATPASQTSPPPGAKQGSGAARALIIAAVLLAIGGGAWYFTRSSGDEQVTPEATATASQPSSGTPTETVAGNSGAAQPASAAVTQTTDSSTALDNAESRASAASTDATRPANSASAASSAVADAQSTVQFAAASTQPISLNRKTISDIQNRLSANASSRVRIAGFASSEGTAEVNQSLSQKRAEAIKRMLVARGIDASRIEIVGMGIAQPIASNDTEEGRRKNRRAEISIL